MQENCNHCFCQQGFNLMYCCKCHKSEYNQHTHCYCMWQAATTASSAHYICCKCNDKIMGHNSFLYADDSGVQGKLL